MKKGIIKNFFLKNFLKIIKKNKDYQKKSAVFWAYLLKSYQKFSRVKLRVK